MSTTTPIKFWDRLPMPNFIRRQQEYVPDVTEVIDVQYQCAYHLNKLTPQQRIDVIRSLVISYKIDLNSVVYPFAHLEAPPTIDQYEDGELDDEATRNVVEMKRRA